MRIDTEKTQALIDKTPTLLPIQKEFHAMMLSKRKAKITAYGIEQLVKPERQKPEQEGLENQGQS